MGEEPLIRLANQGNEALLLEIAPFLHKSCDLVMISGYAVARFLQQQITQPNLTGGTEGQLVQKNTSVVYPDAKQ